jgi:23S rRNA (uracil1939-C5)-methyltransferase
MGSMTIDAGAEAVVRTTGIAVGGDAVGRTDDGQVVFVSGGLADESVRVRIRSTHRRYAHADLVEVIDPAADRIEPLCPHVARGCGGCGWAHIDAAAQRRIKRDVVVEALERLGGIDSPLVEPGPDLPASGHRTTVRAAVVEGRAGYRMAHSSDALAVPSCRVAHPLVESMLVDGRFGGATEATLRAGARTGERLALVDPDTTGVELPDDVLVVGTSELASGRRAWIHEEVAGVRFRVSAESFFQSRPDGAEALVDAVRAALGDADPHAPMADLYCGVGLFAATVGSGRLVVAVERSRSSVADAHANLGADVKVIRSSVERWRPSAAGVVVADPPRTGLGNAGVDAVGRTGAGHLALVSCDAGALGRDAGLLERAGWTLDWARLVDLFPDTPHVEVVTRFTR